MRQLTSLAQVRVRLPRACCSVSFLLRGPLLGGLHAPAHLPGPGAWLTGAWCFVFFLLRGPLLCSPQRLLCSPLCCAPQPCSRCSVPVSLAPALRCACAVQRSSSERTCLLLPLSTLCTPKHPPCTCVPAATGHLALPHGSPTCTQAQLGPGAALLAGSGEGEEGSFLAGRSLRSMMASYLQVRAAAGLCPNCVP